MSSSSIRTSVASSDRFVADELLDPVKGCRLEIKDRGGIWLLSVERIEVGRIVPGDVPVPTDLAVNLDGHDVLVLIAALAGPDQYDGEAA